MSQRMNSLYPGRGYRTLTARRNICYQTCSVVASRKRASGRPRPSRREGAAIAKGFPPPGRIIPVEGVALHVYPRGSGTPTVVLDSALGGSCLTWAHVQPKVAEFTTVCSFDRAGLGWSAASPRPRTSGNIVEELRGLLRAAGFPPPYVLAGHSFGALNVRAFYARYPEEVAGLVLVDAAHPEEWLAMSPHNRLRLEKGIQLTRRGAWLARAGLARMVAALAGTRAADWARTGVRWVTGGAIDTARGDRILAPVAKLPREFYPVLKWMWSQPKFFDALAGQMERLPESARQAAEAGDFGDLPLVVLGAPDADPARGPLHERAATLSRRGRFVLAHQSGHWIPLDEPELVVEAIREVCAHARSAPAARPAGPQ